MDIKEQQQHWDAFGHTDPLWAICTQGPKGNQWDPEAFFATGVEEVADIINQCRGLGLALNTAGTALDFGCGVGRLTQALCGHFEHVFGIDIAPSMIDQARQINRFGDRCRYSVNEDYDIGQFPNAAFDFIMTRAVLQHIEPQFVKRYLRAFLRILKPGATLVFDEHAEPITPPPAWKAAIKKRLPKSLLALRRKLRYRLTRQPVMELYGIPKDEMAAFLRGNGARIIDITPAPKASGAWHAFRYIVSK